MKRTKRSSLFALFSALVFVAIACAQNQAMQQAREDAKTKGKYKVRLTTNPESVVGICKFVMTIAPEQDPIGNIPTTEYADYFRTEAVYKGADTVLVREGKVGEAYICGPAPLNPDGTLKTTFDTPAQHP
ncbi:MAG TPA: hypothetical protein VN032_11475 [Thermoanaerobaculia bacterium]|jgi:hypothetical protein|nr:hypothetical protein [Thermoanaerobaculia bacterium]